MFIAKKHIYANLLLEIKKKNTTFDDVFKFLSKEEQYKSLCLSMRGPFDYKKRIIYMSSNAMNDLMSFRNEMIEKYYKKV